MSRSLKDIMNDVAADAAKARAAAADREAAEKVVSGQAEAARASALAVFNRCFANITTALVNIKRELSALNIHATVIADKQHVKVGSATLMDFGSIIFVVPRTLGTKDERRAAVRFLFAGDEEAGTGSIQVYISKSTGGLGVEGLTRFRVLYLKDGPTSEELERLVNEAFDTVR